MERQSIVNSIGFYLVCSTVIFTTLAYGTVHQPVISLFYLAVVVLIALWAAEGVITGRATISRSKIQIPLLLLGVYGLIQVIPFGSTAGVESQLSFPRTISADPFSTRSTALHIFALSAFFAAALVLVDSEKRLRRAVTIVTGFGFIYAFFAILQSVLSPGRIYGIYEPLAATPFGSFVNRHNFAAIIEMTISFPLALVVTGAVERDKRLLYWVAIALMATALLLSGSRGGLVALVGGIIFLGFLTVRKKGRGSPLAFAGFGAAILVLAIAGSIFVGGDTSLTRFTDAAVSGDVSSSRTHIWAVTIKMIGANLPFGAGLGAYGQAYAQHDTTGGSLFVEQAHNDYLQVLADAGIIGLVLGALFLYWLFREGLRNIRVADPFRSGVAVGAFTACFAVLIHSLFDFVLHITAVSVMFIMSMTLLVASGRRFEGEPEVPAAGQRNAGSVMNLPDRAKKT